MFGVPATIVVLYGLQSWVPTMLVRVYEWDLPTAGRIYGSLVLITGSLGVVTGPMLGKWLLRRGHADYPLRVGMIAATGIGVSMIALPLQNDATLALVCVGFASFFVTLPLALITFVIQTVSPPNMRGVLSGMYVVTSNVMGLAAGPTLVALVTDYVLQDPMMLHVSLSIVSVCIAPIAIAMLAVGLKPLSAWQAENGS